MVQDLFSSAAFLESAGTTTRRGQNRAPTQQGDGMPARKLFHAVVEQVQSQLIASLEIPSAMRVLSSYFTRTEPEIDRRPFCVALADCTLLYHMQMARIQLADVDAYAQLVTDALAQIEPRLWMAHPFMTMVVHDRLYGLPSSTCTKAHCVVLVPPHQFRAFCHMATLLTLHNAVPAEWIAQWHQQLRVFLEAASPMVSHRATALLVRTALRVSQEEQVRELHAILRTKRATMNIDHILACYERLKRIVPDPERGAAAHRALAIHCSEIFLKFRSPIRRDFVERFLYPSLCSEDMQNLVYVPSTREHLTRRLLRQCVPDMSTTNPFYMCLCALIHREMSNEYTAGMEFVRLLKCQMPHAAYFIGTLGMDSNMSIRTFAKTLMVLTRAAALAMAGRSGDGDDVAQSLANSASVAYNVFFALREIVRHSSSVSTRRADEVKSSLKIAIPVKTIDALGQLSTQAFEGRDVVLEPSLLCAELGMVVHELNIDEAIEATLDFFVTASAVCPTCRALLGSAAHCPVDGAPHVPNHVASRRLLSTITECAGTPAVEKKLISLFRDPARQHDAALHLLLIHVLTHGGHHRLPLYRALEPYVRNTLMTLAAADRSLVGDDFSLTKANLMVLHVKLAVLMSNAIDPTYVQSILKIFSELQLRNNHDALVMWTLSNQLLRSGRGNVELLALDPSECNYGQEHPACAAQSTVAADNAQILLQLLDRALHCSAEMKKLTGCTICKLIQDFNVQAPNIVSSLLGPCGFVPVTMDALHELALPVGGESTFWTFIARQMRSSAPARTALLTSLVRSIAMRFRNPNPSEAVAVEGGEATGHVFAVMVYQSMCRNWQLAKGVLHLMCAWAKQKKHSPGKFTCLVYCCVQLASNVLRRHRMMDRAEAAAEPAEDARHFDEAVASTCEALSGQLERLERLVPEVAQNPTFANVLKKIHLRTRILISEATQQPLPYDAAMSMMDDETAAAPSDEMTFAQPSFVEGDGVYDHEIGIDDLHNEADNDVFFGDANPDESVESVEENDRDSNSDDDEMHAHDGGEFDHTPHAGNLNLVGPQPNPSTAYLASSHSHLHHTSGAAARSSYSQGPSFGPSRALSLASQSSAAAANANSVHYSTKMTSRSAAPSSHVSSLGPNISMQPAHRPQFSAVSMDRARRANSVSKGTQTAQDAATNTSFSDHQHHSPDNRGDEKLVVDVSVQASTSSIIAAGGGAEPIPPRAAATTAATASQPQQQQQQQQKRKTGIFVFKSSHHAAAAAPPPPPTPAVDVPPVSDHDSSHSRASSFLRRGGDRNANREHEMEAQQGPQPPPNLRGPRRRLGAATTRGGRPNFVVPAQDALRLLMQAQNPDSLISDFGVGYGVEEFLNQQASAFHNTADYRGGPVAVDPPYHAMARLNVEPRTNNYDEPHQRRPPAPTADVTAPLTVQPLEYPEDHARSKRRRLEDGIPPIPSLRPQDVQHRLAEAQYADRGILDELRSGDPRQLNYADGRTPSLRGIPAELVEQVADSVLRELVVVTHGQRNTQQSGGSSSAKRRFTSQAFDGAENESRWHTLTSAPMPTYASDGRYSMEL